VARVSSRAWIAIGLFALAALLGGWRLDRHAGRVGDEAMHVPNAFHYAERGHLGPDNWYHPPLKHLLVRAGIALAGDGPWGWRLRNVLAGAGSVALIFLLGAELLGSQGVAIAAALLLALDPLHVLFARSTFEDVPAAFFALLGAWLSLRHLRGGTFGPLLGAGLAFGAAVALRPFMGVPLLAVAIALAGLAIRRRQPAALLDLATSFALAPFALYLAAWLPWFRRGYGLGEWLDHQRLWIGAAASVSAFESMLLRLGGPGRWFLGRIGVWIPGSDGRAATLVISNDPPVWLLVLPAVAFMAVAAWRERRWELGAVPAAFALLYAPFLLAARPIFLYSALALLPFAFLAVAWSAQRLLGRFAPAFTALVVIWGLFLYPLAVGANVPEPVYRPILHQLERVGR
jgi:4-amino-4-deoxy-L-arabinose transferase-like glycosyltransferase